MNKKDNDILARDLVLAAFIVMKRQYESRDAGRAGKLQMFLNIHAGTHGDVKNIVAILNNPKSTVKLSEDQKRIYQRALDIVESVSEPETGWVAQIEKHKSGVDIVSIPITISTLKVLYQNGIAANGLSLEEMAKIIYGDEPNGKGKMTSAFLVPESDVITDDTGMTIGIKVGNEVIGTEAEQPKAKPGRKPRNPIAAASAKAQKKGKACCN